MTGFKPKRFDVAGAHPDEAWRGVSNLDEAVEDMRKQFVGTPDVGAVNDRIWRWRNNKPMRYTNARDADVQQFLERGVRIIDDLKPKMALGLSRTQQQVRDRCHELARSMRKVLDKRPDEELRPRRTLKPKMRM